MENNNEVLIQRPVMADVPYENMEKAQNDSAVWNVPCVFHRTKRMPYDEKSVFMTLSDVQLYIDEEQTTSYPGMVVSVVGGIYEERGAYILLSDGTTLIPTPISSSEMAWEGDMA